MLRIGSMNMLLHGVENPDIRYRDSLAESRPRTTRALHLILANPPFAGSLDYESTAKDLQQIVKTKKTELLFLALFLRLLRPAAAPRSSCRTACCSARKAHKALRRCWSRSRSSTRIISMPSGVFKPYAGVSTAILLFTKTNSGGTDHVWFYDMQADGFSLDDKRTPAAGQERPARHPARWQGRGGRPEQTAQTHRQSFLVPKAEIAGNDYDLSINRYKEVEVHEAVGSTRAKLTKAGAEKIEIPLPLLPEQRRIAAILDKADALRAKRREAIAKLDQLLQSVFLDMFGEPLTNARGWREKQLTEVARVQTGGTPPSSEDGMFGGDIPFVTPGDLGGEVKVWRRTLTQEGARRVRTAAAGSTLVCCIGTIGKMGIVWRESAFNQQINAVTWNEDVLPLFGYHALLFLSEEIAHRGASTTVPILKKSEFERFAIIVPPREKQRQFAEVAERIAKHSAASVRAQGASTQFFSSLQQRLFEN
jgi:hypothetical protein